MGKQETEYGKHVKKGKQINTKEMNRLVEKGNKTKSNMISLFIKLRNWGTRETMTRTIPKKTRKGRNETTGNIDKQKQKDNDRRRDI